MMKKIKFLILALLGVTIIPTATNALPLDFGIMNSGIGVLSNKISLCVSSLWYSNNIGLCNSGGPSPSHAQFTKKLYNNFYLEVKGVPSSWFAPRGIFASDVGEGREFRRSYFSEDMEQKYHSLIIPSRTALRYKLQGGEYAMFTEVFLFPHQFILYDPDSGNTLSLHGNNKIINGVILANPGLQSDNLWLVNFRKMKAWSMTVDDQTAWRYHLGIFNENQIKNLKFVKSYNIQSGGNNWLPQGFGNQQNGRGFNYFNDLEYESPAWEVENSNQGNQSSPAEAYNQCSSYWSDVKNLTYYSQKCGDDPADEQTQNRVKVDSWNAEGNLPEFAEGANKNKCGRFANAKKKYKEKYKDNWGKFYADFGTYARTPESVNVEVQCKGVELEHNSPNKSAMEALKDFFKSPLDYFQSFRDRFNDYDGQPIGVYSGKNYYNYDFQADSSKLRLLYEECFSTSWEYSILTKEDRMNSCRKYEQLKSELGKVYSSMTGVKFSSGFQEYINSLEKNNLNDDIGLGKRFISVISDPFYSGFNAVNFVAPVCSGGHYDFFNIFFYLFYFGAVLYIFKLFA